jgi:hypothetical protein
MSKEAIRDFLKPTRGKIILFVLLFLILVFLINSYPCNVIGAEVWPTKASPPPYQYYQDQDSELLLLPEVIKNGFNWSPTGPGQYGFIYDNVTTYQCKPVYLLLYFVYSALLYFIACLILKIKYLKRN